MFKLDANILIVDDMLTMRKLVKKACQTLGFRQFIEAVDGQDAYRKLLDAPTPIQLIISDWNMPNCSGLEFLKKVRANEKHKELPFVLLTAEVEIHQVKAAVEAGVSSYLIKPFTADGLKQKLNTAYTKHLIKKAA